MVETIEISFVEIFKSFKSELYLVVMTILDAIFIFDSTLSSQVSIRVMRYAFRYASS
jgi:hypothetical protein